MWHVASNGLDAVVSCCSHSERDFWCVVRPQCKNNWSDSSDLVVSVVEAGADFHSRGSCACVCVCVRVCAECVCVHARTCVRVCVCARQCCGWQCWSLCDDSLSLSLCKSESGRGAFLACVFSTPSSVSMALRAWLNKGEAGWWGAGGGGVVPGADVGGWVGLVVEKLCWEAQSHGVTSIDGSGTGSRIHTRWGKKSQWKPAAFYTLLVVAYCYRKNTVYFLRDSSPLNQKSIFVLRPVALFIHPDWFGVNDWDMDVSAVETPASLECNGTRWHSACETKLLSPHRGNRGTYSIHGWEVVTRGGTPSPSL